MYIANDNRPVIGERKSVGRDELGSIGKVRRETLRRWVEELLASEPVGAAADDIRYAVAKKIQPAAKRGIA